jgi:hypothetical protein
MEMISDLAAPIPQNAPTLVRATRILGTALVSIGGGIPAAIAYVTSDTSTDGAATAFLFAMVASGAFLGPAIAIAVGIPRAQGSQGVLLPAEPSRTEVPVGEGERPSITADTDETEEPWNGASANPAE